MILVFYRSSFLHSALFIFFSHVFLLSSLFYFCVTCKSVCLTRGNQYFIVLLFSSFFCLKKLFILELNFSSFVLSFPLLSFLSVSLLILSPFLDSSPCLPFYNHQPFCYHFRLLVSLLSFPCFLASSSLLVPYLPVSKFSLPSFPFLVSFPLPVVSFPCFLPSPCILFSSPSFIILPCIVPSLLPFSLPSFPLLPSPCLLSLYSSPSLFSLFTTPPPRFLSSLIFLSTKPSHCYS